MAKERGWWRLTSTVGLSDTDREHTGRCIEGGCTEGEVCEEEGEETDESK